MLDYVREGLLEHGEQLLGRLVGDDGVDWPVEAQLRDESERLARRIDLGEDVDSESLPSRRLQGEDRVADLADGLVEVRGGVGDSLVQVVAGARRQHGL